MVSNILLENQLVGRLKSLKLAVRKKQQMN